MSDSFGAGEGLVIAPDQLSPEALQGVIEEFIMREGTDYGEIELSLDEKVLQLRAQLRSGAALIVFDPISETCTIRPREEWV